MDSQQTPRAPGDSFVERASPMVKQNPSTLPTSFQARPPAHPPSSPRFPANEASVVPGGRPPVQQPRPGLRPEARPPLGPPSTAPTPGQFLQNRPPFGPPRPPNPHGNINQGPPRSLNPTQNPQIVQGAGLRYPGGPPAFRPPANHPLGGTRPPSFPNQSQARNGASGEIRPQRTINVDSFGSTPTSASSFHPRPQLSPQNPDTRQPQSRVIPETVLTSPPRDDSTLLREEPSPVEARSNPSNAKFSNSKNPQQRETMQVADSRSPSLGAGTRSENERTDNFENNEAVKRGEGDNNEEGDDDDDDDDDDDVVMDEDAESSSKAAVNSSAGPTNGALPGEQLIRTDSPGARSLGNSSKSPVPEHVDRATPSPAKIPSDSERPGSRNSYKKSSTPSPTPPTEHPDRPSSTGKINTNKDEETRSGDLQTETNSNKTPSTPVPTNPSPGPPNNEASTESGLSSRSESRQGDPKSPALSATSERNGMPPSRSPASLSRTPENPSNLSVPPSPSSRQSSASPSSPKSPKSPMGSVKGFDDGEPRSLSPKSPGRSITPASQNSIPVSPAISNKSVTENDQKRATFADAPATPINEPMGKPPTPSSGSTSERARTPSGAGTSDGQRESSMKRSSSGRSIKSDAGSESGADRTNHSSIPTTNGVALSPTKKLPPSKSRENNEKRTAAGSPIKSPSKSVKSLPRTPDGAVGPPSTAEKKIPMNKVQVGAAPSPNLKTVRSKIGSLDNASYKPGGGKVKIENRKLDFSKAQPKIAAKNDKYMPSGGDKKITQVKLQWNAKPKVGSLDNATYKPGGGDKKIETVKLDFKDKAKPKVGSKDNAKHVPGGGAVKSSSTPPKTPQEPAPNNEDIETQKIDIKAESKIGSLDNVKHKPGGGDKKIFNDKDYLRQTGGSNVESLNGSGAQMKELAKTPAERPNFIEIESSLRTEPNPPPSTPTRRRRSPAPVSPLTPRALRKSLQSKSPESPSVKRVTILEESPRDCADEEKPKSPRNSLSAASSSSISSSSSRKGLSLPKLTRSPPSEISTLDKRESSMKLPKLVETSSLSSRVRQMQ